MGWWNNTKPKGFRHTYIYIDERNEAVRQSKQSRVETSGNEDNELGNIPDKLSMPMFAMSERRRLVQRSSMRVLGVVIVPLLILFFVLIICMLLF